MPYHYKCPSKINLFLNVLNKRPDGYHSIQSIFQLINLYDSLKLSLRNDDKVTIKCNKKELESDNIIFDAIDLFKKKHGPKKIGLDIILKKNIPLGSGLGGGSSNAASTLLALNDIFEKNISMSRLLKLALSIGSDVPFFIRNKNAWVEGRGEVITEIFLKPHWFVIIFSKQKISTKKMYDLLNIHSDPDIYGYDDFISGALCNVFENITFRRYPDIKKSFDLLSEYGQPRMSGTGGTIFLPLNSENDALEVLSKLPPGQNAKVVKSL